MSGIDSKRNRVVTGPRSVKGGAWIDPSSIGLRERELVVDQGGPNRVSCASLHADNLLYRFPEYVSESNVAAAYWTIHTCDPARVVGVCWIADEIINAWGNRSSPVRNRESEK